MKFKISNIFKGDKGVWMVFFLLVCISVLEVFSSTSTLTYKTGNYWAPIIRHVGFLLMGLMFMVFTMHLNYRSFKSLYYIVFPGSILLLIYVLFLGEKTNEASRWISIFGFQFQPSEFAKGAMVLAVAKVMSAMRTETEESPSPRTLKYVLIASAPIILLIGVENCSTGGLLLMVVLAMAFVGGVPIKQIGKVMGALAIVAALGLCVIMAMPNDEKKENDKQNLTEVAAASQTAPDDDKGEKGGVSKLFHRASTWKSRILDFVNGSEDDPDKYKINDLNRQVSYANIAIVKSDIVGKLPGNSWARDYLPQAYSDFIFAIILEELGVFGGIGIIFLYLVLLYRAGIVAQECEHYFPAILAMGLAILMVAQAMFNMMVAVGLAPVTGQPLPFISRGGSSTLANCIYVGVILSISISAPKRNRPETAVKRQV